MTTRRKTGTGRTQQAAPAGRRAAASRTKAKVASLAADCTIAQAALLKSQLGKVLGAASPVTLDLASVRRIDTAGFQVLAAFIRERRAAGLGVQCEGASESFSVTAALLGLGAIFGPAVDERLLAPAGRA